MVMSSCEHGRTTKKLGELSVGGRDDDNDERESSLLRWWLSCRKASQLISSGSMDFSRRFLEGSERRRRSGGQPQTLGRDAGELGEASTWLKGLSPELA